MALPEIHAIVTDLDGTLVWNGRKAWKVFKASCREKHVPFPTFEEYRFKYSDGSFPDNLRVQGVEGTDEELRFLVAKHWSALPSASMADGAIEMLTQWRGMGLPLGLATRLYAPFALSSIGKRDLEQFFVPHIYTGLEEKASVLEMLAFACGPEHLLFLTDTVRDVLEALQAGCVVGACTRGHGHPEALKAANPHFFFGSWQDIPKHVNVMKH